MKNKMFMDYIFMAILLLLFLSILFVFKDVNNIWVKCLLITYQIIAISFPIIELIIKRKKKGEIPSLLGYFVFSLLLLIPLGIAILLAAFNLMIELKIMTLIVIVITSLINEKFIDILEYYINPFDKFLK